MRASTTNLSRGRPADPIARAERRSQILEAAHRCFARKGFHQTTTAEISAEAGISVAGLYQYFVSKSELILALIQLDLAESIALVDSLADSVDFFGDAERILHDAMQDKRQEGMSRLRLEITAEASRSPEIGEMVASCDEQFTAAMVRAIENAQSRGQISEALDPLGLALAMNCLMDGLFGRISLAVEMRGPLVAACINTMRRAAA